MLSTGYGAKNDAKLTAVCIRTVGAAASAPFVCQSLLQPDAALVAQTFVRRLWFTFALSAIVVSLLHFSPLPAAAQPAPCPLMQPIFASWRLLNQNNSLRYWGKGSFTSLT